MRLEGIRLGERGRGREGGWRDEAGGGWRRLRGRRAEPRAAMKLAAATQQRCGSSSWARPGTGEARRSGRRGRRGQGARRRGWRTTPAGAGGGEPGPGAAHRGAARRTSWAGGPRVRRRLTRDAPCPGRGPGSGGRGGTGKAADTGDPPAVPPLTRKLSCGSGGF